MHLNHKLHNLGELKTYLTTRLAEILESHVRSSQFGEEIIHFFQEENNKLEKQIRKLEQKGPSAEVRLLLDEARRCKNIRTTTRELIRERQKKWKKNQHDLKDLLLETTGLIEELESTLIDKDLLERQSLVLRNIILSHEKVTQWKEFIQEILADFHSFFPFHVFFIAFTDEHNLTLNIFYMGKTNEKMKKFTKTNLVQSMLEKLSMPTNTLVDMEEFYVECTTCINPAEQVQLISVPVPELLPNMEGVLGVGYGYNTDLTDKEKDIIISILSVMVMVVGSSKALSKTLAELEFHSVHDPLTGLHNRRYFKDILNYEINRADRHGNEFSILMIDMDNFKYINDSFGHPCGDKALYQVGELLRIHCRKGDIVTRYGGDEFAIILTNTPRAGAIVLAENLRKTIKDNRFFNEPTHSEYHVTISIGIITYPQDAKTTDDLLSGADLALYRSKEIGKDAVSIIDSVEQGLQTSRKILANVEKVRKAIQKENIQPYYHSIIDSLTGKNHAFEVLARMKDDSGGIITADNFIETAEKYGLIWDLDRLIISKSLSHKKELDKKQKKDTTKLFINLSPQVIQGRGILNFAEEQCRKMKIPPTRIVFEILERDAISEMTAMRVFLKDLREKGFQFALDDFGSGYNSFHYLRELKFDYVKIDGAFVKNILHSKIDHALVKNLSNLCKDLGIKTIAEYVETEEIFHAILEMGIDYAQGYFISHPIASLN